LCMFVGRAGYGCTEVRMKLAEDLFRIPDFAMFEHEPEEQLPTSSPLLIIEINSPDDRLSDVERKSKNTALGRRAYLVRRAELKKLYVYERGLVNVQQLDLPKFDLAITLTKLFSSASMYRDSGASLLALHAHANIVNAGRDAFRHMES